MAEPYPGDLLVHLRSFVVLLENLQAGRPAAFERTADDLKLDRSVLRRRIRTLSGWVGCRSCGGEARAACRRAQARSSRSAPRRSSRFRSTWARTSAPLARERIVVACTGTITTQLIPPVLAKLERDRSIRIAVCRAGGSSSCQALVRSGEVDLGVVRAQANPSGVTSKLLASDRLWFVVPSVAREAKAHALSLDDMAAVPLVLYGPSSRTRKRVLERLGPLAYPRRFFAERSMSGAHANELA